MKILTLYLDTSVIGGCFDDEWKDATLELFRQADLGLYQLATSVVTTREVLGAPPEVQQQFSATFTDSAQIRELTPEAESLAQAYLAASVVTPKFADDARHVAIATVHGLAVIVSWNFHHLVNLRREAAFNAVNLLQGYPSVRIVSPLELIHENDEDENV
jgi:predicted nucleic acid-binding protein